MGNLFSMISLWRLSSIFRIVLPGLFLALLLLPILNPIVKIDNQAEIITIFIPLSIVFGLFLCLLRNIVYQIYEGRILWPKWIEKKIIKNIGNKVERMFQKAENIDDSTGNEYKELWYWLRLFPLNGKGDPIARRPTILGNILQGYEEYPWDRYGMDSIFYWYRLWLTLPKDFLDKLDQVWAEAECFLYISFSSFLMSLVYAIAAIIKLTIFHIPKIPESLLDYYASIPNYFVLGILIIILLIVGYIFYRFSIPIHRRNGEYFKAVFDLFRENIKKITSVSPDEKKDWIRAWSYLQYNRVQCNLCKTLFFAEEKRCPHCGNNAE